MAWEPIVDKAIGNCEFASWSLLRIALERIDAARADAPGASTDSPAKEG